MVVLVVRVELWKEGERERKRVKTLYPEDMILNDINNNVKDELSDNAIQCVFDSQTGRVILPSSQESTTSGTITCNIVSHATYQNARTFFLHSRIQMIFGIHSDTDILTRPTADETTVVRACDALTI